MTVEALPWSIQGQSHNATVARNAVAAVMGAPSAALAAAASITTAGGSHGVVLGGDFAVTQNGTPNMSVNVAAGRAFVRSQETASLGHGTWTAFNDATVNLAVAASDPTNPRRDLVILQVRDSNYSGASTDARLTVVTGTPAASPVDPTVPVNSLVLARIAVAAASSTVVNANITDLRTRAYAIGGTCVCTSSTRPTGASLFAGLKIYETDTNRPMVYNGTGWRAIRPVRIQASGSGGTTSGTTELTVATLTLPDQGAPGRLVVTATLRADKSVGSDVFEVRLKDGAAAVIDYVYTDNYSTTKNVAKLTADVAVSAGSSTTVTMRIVRDSGTGTATVFAGAVINQIIGIFIPDA